MKAALLLRALTAALLASVLVILPAAAQEKQGEKQAEKPDKQETLDKVSFGTNWVAEAEHGGFFQAVADGTYRKYGLDVTIVPGGPNDNNRMLLIAGKIDFFMAANTLMSFDAVANHVPLVTIAAIFQKDPQVLLTHPELKITRLEELKPLTLFVSKEGIAGYFQWLKSEYGFDEKNVRPYTFNPQPFIANAQSAMQGYVTSEPFAVEKAAGFKPGIILLADQWLQRLLDPDRDAARGDRQEAGPGAALRRRLRHRLVQLSVWRQFGRQRDDQEAQSRNDRRASGLLRGQDEGIWHRRFRRQLARRHRRDDRRARRKLLQQDGESRRGPFRYRLPHSYTLRFVNKGVGLDLRPRK